MLAQQRLSHWAKRTTDLIYAKWDDRVYQFGRDGPPKYLNVAALKGDIAKEIEKLFLKAEDKVDEKAREIGGELPGNIFDRETRLRVWHEYDYLADIYDILCLNMNRIAEETPFVEEEFDTGFFCYYMEACRMNGLHAYRSAFGQTTLFDAGIIKTILQYFPMVPFTDYVAGGRGDYWAWRD